jgi:hypothetical protein
MKPEKITDLHAICKCGHTAIEHSGLTGKCGGCLGDCDCLGFSKSKRPFRLKIN